MTEYRPVIDGAVLEIIAKSSKAEKQFLFQIFKQLGNNPFQKGEFVENIASGRPLHVKRFGHWQITYWPDHGACELRIVAARRLKR